jgi:hypothetical protein
MASAPQTISASRNILPLLPHKSFLVPCDEGLVPARSALSILLALRDHNWLSEFPVLWVGTGRKYSMQSREDCKARNNSIAYHRSRHPLRFCAHISPTTGHGRSSAFPSSLRQLYQASPCCAPLCKCDMMPSHVRKGLGSQDKPSQGCNRLQRFWIYSGVKVGVWTLRMGSPSLKPIA